ncbi:MAG: hypothetical protein M3353_06850 [Actinomycetota bacterium]|nr:hypothetical protein [Actinomycetota bacterium]
MQGRLEELSAAAGVDPLAGEPFEVWLRLRDAYGRRVTIVDLYELVAARRRLRAPELPISERRDLSREAIPVVYPGFHTVDPESARTPEPVVLCTYDDRWPPRFEEWRGQRRCVPGRSAIPH